MEIIKYLDKHNIKYHKFEHPAVFTCDQSENLKINVNGMHAKSLLTVGKKSKKLYMIVIPCKDRLDTKKIRKIINEELRFAFSEELMHSLSLSPGSVSPLALIRDKDAKITILFDKKVISSEIVNFHPGINTQTLEIKINEFNKFLSTLKNKIIIFD